MKSVMMVFRTVRITEPCQIEKKMTNTSIGELGEFGDVFFNFGQI